MKKALPCFFYFFYLTTALVFFLYHLFPENAVRERIQNETKKMLPNMDLLVGRTRPGLVPPRLQIAPAVLAYRELDLVRLDTLNISPRIFALSEEKAARCTYKAVAYGGVVSGSFEGESSENPTIADLESSFSGLRLEQISAVSKFFPYKTSGALKGTASFNAGADLKGDLSLKMIKIRVEFENALTGLEVLEFTEAEAAVNINGKQIQVTGCDMKGKQLDLFVTGRIYAGLYPENCILDLSGFIRLQPDFFIKLRKKIPEPFFPHKKGDAGGFPFRVTGTVDRPNFFWN